MRHLLHLMFLFYFSVAHLALAGRLQVFKVDYGADLKVPRLMIQYPDHGGIIQNENDFKKLWSILESKTNPPIVDFKKYSMIWITGGKELLTFQLSYIEEQTQKIKIALKQEIGSNSNELYLWLIPKTKKPIEFELHQKRRTLDHEVEEKELYSPKGGIPLQP